MRSAVLGPWYDDCIQRSVEAPLEECQGFLCVYPAFGADLELIHPHSRTNNPHPCTRWLTLAAKADLCSNRSAVKCAENHCSHRTVAGRLAQLSIARVCVCG